MFSFSFVAAAGEPGRIVRMKIVPSGFIPGMMPMLTEVRNSGSIQFASVFSRRSMGIAKPIPGVSRRTAMFMPIIRPLRLISGPPLLPG